MTMVIEVRSAMRVVTTVKVLVMRKKAAAPKKVGVRGEKTTVSRRTTTMMIEAVRTTAKRSVKVEGVGEVKATGVKTKGRVVVMRRARESCQGTAPAIGQGADRLGFAGIPVGGRVQGLGRVVKTAALGEVSVVVTWAKVLMVARE